MKPRPSYHHAIDSIETMIGFIGDDSEREGLIDTPYRVVRSWKTLFGGYDLKVQDVLTFFEKDTSDEMVLLKNIEIYSTCEHHMLPFFGKCHIAYLPNERVVGVSKLARLMEIFARRLQIQERICRQITAALDEHVQPKGSACVIEAQHFCMTSRGVEKQNSIMVTSSLTGAFRNDRALRAEFLSLIGV